MKLKSILSRGRIFLLIVWYADKDEYLFAEVTKTNTLDARLTGNSFIGSLENGANPVEVNFEQCNLLYPSGGKVTFDSQQCKEYFSELEKKAKAGFCGKVKLEEAKFTAENISEIGVGVADANAVVEREVYDTPMVVEAGVPEDELPSGAAAFGGRVYQVGDKAVDSVGRVVQVHTVLEKGFVVSRMLRTVYTDENGEAYDEDEVPSEDLYFEPELYTEKTYVEVTLKNDHYVKQRNSQLEQLDIRIKSQQNSYDILCKDALEKAAELHQFKELAPLYHLAIEEAKSTSCFQLTCSFNNWKLCEVPAKYMEGIIVLSFSNKGGRFKYSAPYVEYKLERQGSDIHFHKVASTMEKLGAAMLKYIEEGRRQHRWQYDALTLTSLRGELDKFSFGCKEELFELLDDTVATWENTQNEVKQRELTSMIETLSAHGFVVTGKDKGE